jgi:hypothetical protein
MNETKANETGRRRRIPSAAWVAVGLLAAGIIAPTSALAASNLVGIVGGNGVRAGVTRAGQLQTTQTSPGNFVTLFASPSSGACDFFYKVPSGDGLIIESVTFNSITVTSPGLDTFAALYPNATCKGSYVLDNNPGGTGETSVPLTPGLALKSGTALSMVQDRDVVEVYITGYLVPAGDVPSNRVPAVLGHAGGTQAQR